MSSEPQELASGKLLLDEPAQHVTRLRISNPEKRGALDHEILDTLADTVHGLEARCLLLTGEGEMFSAGYDIGTFDDTDFERQASTLVAHPFHAAIEVLERFPYPSVAALNGHAIGGGLEVALSCDIRIAARGIKLGMPPAKLGLVYSHTGLRRFMDVVGVARTRELFLLGRNIPARRALEWGLVNEVVIGADLEEVALDWARELAANAPLSVQGNKRVIRELLRAEGELDPDVERELIALREACFASEDMKEGVRAFGEKRPARWQGR